MDKTLKITFLFVLGAFVLPAINAEPEIAKYCQLVPVGTKFPSFKSCQSFYTCVSQKQVVESICTGTDVFDKDLQICVPRTDNNCVVNSGNPCKNQDATWVRDAKDCNHWHYCFKGEILGSGSCGLGQYFNDTTRTCVNGKCPYNTDYSQEINNLCQIIQNNKFFGDFNDCAVWYKCNGSKMNKGKCLNDLLYDTQTRMCLKNNGEICDRTGGVLPPMTQGLNSKNCIKDGSKIADVKTCSIYYECKETKWMMLVCPTNQYFDIKSEQCTDRQIAKVAKGCNRCQFTTATWTNAVDTNCRKYDVCKDGHTIASGSCQIDSFFNEELQYCLINTMNLDKYKENNGACADTTCNTIHCKIEECLLDSKHSEYECQLKVYVNEGGLPENVCRDALCKDPKSYSECNVAVCDDDCKLQKCLDLQHSKYECKLEACVTKGVSESQCEIDLCIDPSIYPECDCDIDCELKKCENAGEKSKYECHLDVCKRELSEEECETKLCTQPTSYAEECEIVTCHKNEELTPFDCKLNACKNKGSSHEECQIKICNIPGEDYPECNTRSLKIMN